MAIPSNMSTSLHELASLADEIWFLSGDTSIDSSWYTKRASLSSIYAATDLFMTTDKSNEFKDTQEFMERRFQDGHRLGTAMGNLGQWAGFTASAGINVLRSKGVRI
jgi:ubiquinone biosynthesis protein COQ9